jgi:Ca-activated chloride channel family protein
LLAQGGARQMGLLLYAGDAYLASPLTNDAAALSALLFAVDDRTIPDGGTRPARALALARRVLRDAQIVGADVVLIGAGEGVDPAAAREATRLGAEGHALHTLFVTGDAQDAPGRRAALAGLAAAGGGLAGSAAEPDDVATRISGRAIAHVEASALQALGWRDCGRLALIFAAACLLSCFRRSAS